MQQASTVISNLVSGRQYVTFSLVPEKKALSCACARLGSAMATSSAVTNFFISLVLRVLPVGA